MAALLDGRAGPRSRPSRYPPGAPSPTPSQRARCGAPRSAARATRVERLRDDVEDRPAGGTHLGDRHPGRGVGGPVGLEDPWLRVRGDGGCEDQVHGVEVLVTAGGRGPLEVDVEDVEQLPHGALDPTLLTDLAEQRGARRLAVVDPAAGQRPG